MSEDALRFPAVFRGFEKIALDVTHPVKLLDVKF